MTTRPPVISTAGASVNPVPAQPSSDEHPPGSAAADDLAADRREAVSEREQRILGIIETARAKPIKFRDQQITMAHGAGGKATQALIEGLFVPAFTADRDEDGGERDGDANGNGDGRDGNANGNGNGNGALAELADAGRVTTAGGTALALTTDSFVVKPIRFPGGSIGELAVNGTVNDLAMAGARPLALSLSLILEEGLPAEDLRAEVEAIARAAREAEVQIVAGDTKVVERGHADAMYICTTGIGETDARAELSPKSLQPGDQILVSGSIGEHGTAIMLARDEFSLDAEIVSDTRSLWPTVDALLDAAGPSLRCLRDATRGGVASVLNELARASHVSIAVREADVPVRPEVAGAAEILGIDPMYVANEGRLVAVVAAEQAEAALQALRSIDGGETAAAIGEVGPEPPGMVLVETAFGGRRVMDLLVGDPLPRIC
ncbi:MAG TPA: hydrogenase expression/formation protein HypE [Solirubrobacteraceae bacterium]|jgi:hydrogenase expression/formation protein HypE